MTLSEQCEYDASGALRVASGALRVDRASRAVRSRNRRCDPRAAARRVWTVKINDASSRRGGRPTVITGVPTLSLVSTLVRARAPRPRHAGVARFHFPHFVVR